MDCNIEKNGCRIACLERATSGGKDFRMQVDFPAWLTNEWLHENRETIQKVALYTANKLEMRLLTDAVSFAREIKGYGLALNERDGVWIFYDEEKSAFIRPFIFSNKMDIRPFLEFSSVNEHGFTLTPGSFSDFIMTTRTFDQSLIGYTTDFSAMHFGVASVYLLNFCENLEKIIIKKDTPADFEEYSIYHFQRMTTFGRAITTKIHNEIDALCAVNKSKRIDSLIVNKKSIYDLIIEHDMTYRLNVRGINLLKVALALGKTVFQVEKFVKKYIDKKQAS